MSEVKKGSEPTLSKKVLTEKITYVLRESKIDSGTAVAIMIIIEAFLKDMVVVPEEKWNELKTLILNPPDPYGTPYWDVNLRVLKEWQDKLRKAVE
jgi:hypothetical protein